MAWADAFWQGAVIHIHFHTAPKLGIFHLVKKWKQNFSVLLPVNSTTRILRVTKSVDLKKIKYPAKYIYFIC